MSVVIMFFAILAALAAGRLPRQRLTVKPWLERA